jgi:hypothetical protein
MVDEASEEVSTAIDEDIRLWASLKRIIRSVSMFNLKCSPGLILSVRLLATVIGPMVRFSAAVQIDLLPVCIPLLEK